METLRIDFKISIEVLDDALRRKKYFRYNRNFFEAREFSSIISNEDYAYILWCTYQISKFSLFNLESFQSEDLEISKISQWMKLNIFRNSCLKKI